VFDIHKPLIPAGDFVTVTQFRTPDGSRLTSVELNVGRQQDCVPEIVNANPALH
jgi:hypothetical protein